MLIPWSHGRSYPLQGVDRWMRSMLHRAKNSGLCDWDEFCGHLEMVNFIIFGLELYR